MLINLLQSFTRLSNFFQPKFIELAKLWQQLQNQLYVLSEINSINEKLMIMSENTIQWNKICYKINECEGLRGVKYLGFNEDNVTDNEESDDGDEIDNAQLSGKFNNHNAIDLITNNELLSVVQYEAELTVCNFLFKKIRKFINFENIHACLGYSIDQSSFVFNIAH